MNNQRYIELSKISNAVLLGEIVKCDGISSQGGKLLATYPTGNKHTEKQWCEAWCKKQIKVLGTIKSTAVLKMACVEKMEDGV